MGKLHTIRGGGDGERERRPAFISHLITREPAWEVRQIQREGGEVVGDLVIMYTPSQVRAMVVLRTVSPDTDWEAMDTWVIAQIDNYDRRYVIDYYEGSYVTGVEGPAERSEDDVDLDDE